MRPSKKKLVLTAAGIILAVLLTVAICLRQLTARAGDILLFGEIHSNQECIDMELMAWSKLYNEEGLRDLFIELPYYTAQYLNMWMAGEDEGILEQVILGDAEGTQGATQEECGFYRRLRELCPETVFHGTDVGHQNHTTGARYIQYLADSGREDSEEYRRALECMEQGETYYSPWERGEDADDGYREDKMAENLIEEYERLGRRKIMGIYGLGHTIVGGTTDWAASDLPNMASRIAEKYPGIKIEPPRVGLANTVSEADKSNKKKIELGGREYDAWYGGKSELPYNEKFSQIEVWVLEDAYEDAKSIFTTGITLYCEEFPVPTEPGQVFQVQATMRSGGNTPTWFFRTDGRRPLALPVAEQLKD